MGHAARPSARTLPVLVLFVALACSRAERGSPSEDEPDSGAPYADSLRAKRDVAFVFDPKTIAVGDTIGTLVADRVAITAAYDSTPVGSVHFRGNVKLTGQVIPHPDPEFESVCFEVDPLSASALPRWKGDARRIWFCFSNTAEASRQVIPYLPGQKYEILIDEYTVHRGMSDEVNEAHLVEVLGRSS